MNILHIHHSVSRKFGVFLFGFAILVGSNFAYALGPYNYYKNSGDSAKILEKVEYRHLPPGVINLQPGKSLSNSSVYDDLQYSLRVFPNHPIALNAMTKLFRQKEKYGYKLDKYTYDLMYHGMGGEKTNAEYFLNAAVEFAPDDGIARLIYGIHLQKLKKYDEAIEMYKQAEQLQPDHSEISYNLGLLYFEINKYKDAKRYAQKAYDNGYPLQGLKNKLVKAGYW